MTERRELISGLARELSPVPWWRRPAAVAWLWAATSVLFVVAASTLIQPWRPVFARQLLSAPAFALEVVLALAGFGVILWLGFRSAVPAAVRSRHALALGLLAFLPWLALLLYGLWQPALEPSMLGKRAACYLEVLLLGTPPLLLGLGLCRGLYPLQRWTTGALLGAAAGMIPGVAMQMACMYIVPHGLTHHVLPIAGTTMAGAVLGVLVLCPPR